MVPRPCAAALLAALLAALPAAALVPALPVNEVQLPCDDLAGQPRAQGAVCGTWERKSDLPAPREGMRLAWLEQADLLLAFGGRDASGAPTGTLWAYDLAADAWSVRSGGPPARADHVFVAKDTADEAYVFGGRDASGARADVWVYDHQADIWTQKATVGGPAPRWGAVGGYDTANARFLVFGGTDGTQTFGDLWAYTPGNNVWSKLASGPAPRSFAAGLWDRARIGLIFTGGVDAHGAERNDTWFFPVVLNPGWQELGPSPTNGSRGAAAWDFRHGSMHLFGGSSGGVLSDASSLYVASRNLWLTETDVPSARADAIGEYDIDDERSFLAGGRGAAGTLAELWTFETALAHAWM